MEKIDIRKISPDDYPAIHEVYRQCEDFLAPAPVAKAAADMVIADIQEAKAESGVYGGIFYDNNLIGVVSYIPSHFEFRLLDAYILLLMIIPAYRRKGIGGEVLRQVEKEICTRARIRSILSSVQINNLNGLRFWEKHGYKIFSGPELRPDKTTVYHLSKDIERGGKSNG